jgi:hypothetical protein
MYSAMFVILGWCHMLLLNLICASDHARHPYLLLTKMMWVKPRVMLRIESPSKKCYLILAMGFVG